MKPLVRSSFGVVAITNPENKLISISLTDYEPDDLDDIPIRISLEPDDQVPKYPFRRKPRLSNSRYYFDRSLYHPLPQETDHPSLRIHCPGLNIASTLFAT